MISIRTISTTSVTMARVGTPARAGVLLALLMLGWLPGAALLRAQEPAATPQQQRSQAAPKQRAPGEQLAHETREASGGEKDETAEFKQSASVRLVARLTGVSLEQASWLSTGLNFVVIAALIFWGGRKFLPGMFRERTSAIQKATHEAQKASEEARRRLTEIESRLMKLDVEIGMMRDAAEREGMAEESRLQAAAQAAARKIVQSAEQEIAAAAKAARRALTGYAADLAVELAKKQIHVDAATDEALVRTFAGQLGAAPGGPGNAAGDAGKDRR